MDYRPKKSLDIWLNDKGFYRKHVPMDETCFFRAISDQCRLFLLDKTYNEAFKILRVFMNTGISFVFDAISCRRDFIIIDSETFKIQNATNNNFKKVITLCRMRDNHYDSVIPKNEIDTAGFCQSIIYKLLYEDIFGFEKVDDIVTKMLYPDDVTPPENTNLFDAFLPAELDKSKEEDDIQANPPFPYKVAKALDPKQYRNIEFDAWNQTRKELRLKDWYMGGDDFKVGTKCLFLIDSNSYECYIQELCYQGKENVCLIYVVAWASKETVKREELMPMPDAKPWPLPYAISKNIENSVETITTMTEDMRISYKRRRNVRRFMNSRTFNNSNMLCNDTNNNRNEVSSLEGCALIASPGPYIEENLNSPLKKESSNIIPYEETIQSSCENNVVPYEFNDNNEPNNQQFSNVLPPYSSPYDTCNPQMSIAAQYNAMIQEERNNTKVTTVYSKFVEKTYSNNNIAMPNLNNLTPPPSPGFPIYNSDPYQIPVVPGNYPEQLSIMPAPIYPANQPVQPVPVLYSDGNILGPIMPVPSPVPAISPQVTLAPIYSAPILSNYCWTCNWYSRYYCNTSPDQYFPPMVPAPCYPGLPAPAPPVQDNVCYDYEPQYPATPTSPHCFMWPNEETY